MRNGKIHEVTLWLIFKDMDFSQNDRHLLASRLFAIVKPHRPYYVHVYSNVNTCSSSGATQSFLIW